MNSDDVTFVSTLLLCCAVGGLYRRIENTFSKRVYGTGLGMLVVCLVCGAHAYHSVLMVGGNLLIIVCGDRWYIHDMCLVYSWLYLSYLHFGVSMSKYGIWLHQMLALRLVGLASDLHISEYLTNQTLGGITSKLDSKYYTDSDVITTEPGALEMLHYSFSFIGIQKGPYYRWKTYSDHFAEPFSTLGDCGVITERKFKKVAVFGVLYLWLCSSYPLEAYSSTEFYRQHGPDFRLLYSVPLLVRYFLVSQMIALLSGAVCSEAGFGLYPASCKARPGAGANDNLEQLTVAPSTQARLIAEDRPSNAGPRPESAAPGPESAGPTVAQSIVEPPSRIASSQETLLVQVYNFTTIKGFDNSALMLAPSMRRTLRSWDMSVQYWFWAHVYRKIEHPNRVVKNTITFIVWTLWCGPSINQMILAPTLWLYCNLEDMYQEVSRKRIAANESEQKIWNVGFWIMRMLCLVYVTPCLMVKRKIFGYYNSIYWAFHVILLAFAAAAATIAPSRQRDTLSTAASSAVLNATPSTVQ